MDKLIYFSMMLKCMIPYELIQERRKQKKENCIKEPHFNLLHFSSPYKQQM